MSTNDPREHCWTVESLGHRGIHHHYPNLWHWGWIGNKTYHFLYNKHHWNGARGTFGPDYSLRHQFNLYATLRYKRSARQAASQSGSLVCGWEIAHPNSLKEERKTLTYLTSQLISEEQRLKLQSNDCQTEDLAFYSKQTGIRKDLKNTSARPSYDNNSHPRPKCSFCLKETKKPHIRRRDAGVRKDTLEEDAKWLWPQMKCHSKMMTMDFYQPIHLMTVSLGTSTLELPGTWRNI